jgi:hypothetical protein
MRADKWADRAGSALPGNGSGRTAPPHPDMAADFHRASQNPLGHENRVHSFRVMKNITLSAGKNLMVPTLPFG